MIKFMQFVILYQICSYPTDMQFLAEDLGITLVLSFLMGGTPPYHKLSAELPEESLIGISTVVSVVGSIMIQLTFQLIVFFIMKDDPYNKRVEDPNDP